MIFEPLGIAGAFRIRLEPHADERGFFARTWCDDEARAAGADARIVQESIARNARAGTLRGLHLDAPPHGAVKIVRCVRGAIYDAIVDLRDGSATFLRVEAFTLDAQRGDALYVPPGCAHGYQTLVDDTDVLYAMTERYVPAAARVVAWDDPQIAIAWPLSDVILSDADRAAPSLRAFLAQRDALRTS